MKTIGVLLLLTALRLAAAPMPQIVRTGDKATLLVDGKPFIVLGAQVHNSSGWPSKLESLLPGATSMHLNTLEVPIYWEDVEPAEGQFRFTTLDNLIRLARGRSVRLVLLWFGTWKNGTMDYAPAWVKNDVARFPRMIDAGGRPVRVLTPLSEENLNADRKAFAQVLRHLKQIDGDQHTVIMVQVENEPGSLFTDRDHSRAANEEFAGTVPARLTQALGAKPGTWTQVFGVDADECFAAYSVSRYVNAVAEAGKAEYPLPLYANVWLREQKNFMRPGEAYPSGGGTLNVLNIWKAMTPSLDVVAPDNYVLDYQNYQKVLAGYLRKDNPLLVPETGGPRFASNIFYALGEFDSLGYAPFGLDSMLDGENVLEIAKPYADDCRLLEPAIPLIAQLQGTGKLHAAVEEQYLTERLISSSKFDVLVQFGNLHPEYGGIFGTQTPGMTGRALVAEISADEFIVIGFDAHVQFRPVRGSKEQNAQFLRVEEGTFEDGQFRAERILNGDQTFFSANLPPQGAILRLKVMAY